MQRRQVPRNDPRYKQLRDQNNRSVQRSREKSRRERDVTLNAINELEKDNEKLAQNVQLLKQEYEQLQRLFKQHTGIDIEQMISSEHEPKSTPPKPVNPPIQPKENPSKPVLTINTTEQESSTNNELDANNLDGSVVIINGVQYKIVSLNNS